jgi:hypothetical protein
MINSVPYEVIAGPATLYIADYGTTFPLVDATPATPGWAKIGTSGDLNYDEEGITIEHAQETSPWRALGDAGTRKMFRMSEDFRLRVILVDMTLEQYRYALEHNTVGDTAAGAGTAGFRKLGLSRNLDMTARALLVRMTGLSSYGSVWNAQYEIPRAQQTGNPSPVIRKGQPMGLALEWTALVDTTASTPEEYFGRLVIQDEDQGT